MWQSGAHRPRSVGNNPNEKTGPPTFRLKLGLEGERRISESGLRPAVAGKGELNRG